MFVQKHEKYRIGNAKNHEQQKIIGPLQNLKICKIKIEYSQIEQNRIHFQYTIIRKKHLQNSTSQKLFKRRLGLQILNCDLKMKHK